MNLIHHRMSVNETQNKIEAALSFRAYHCVYIKNDIGQIPLCSYEFTPHSIVHLINIVLMNKLKVFFVVGFPFTEFL